jgi:hypothetical protein
MRNQNNACNVRMLRFMSMQEKNRSNSQKIEVGLSLGSNMGDRLQYLRAAVRAIQAHTLSTQITGLSPYTRPNPSA